MTDNLHEMTCEECEDLLPLVADGVLDEQDDPSLFHHLARCQRCQAELAMYDRIGIELELATNEQPEPIRMQHWLMRTGGVLAAAAMLLTGGWLTLRKPAAVGVGSASQSSTVLRVVESDDGQQGLLVRHADGSVEVVEELDQPRRGADQQTQDELRAAGTQSQQPNAARNPLRPAIK